MVQRLFVLQSNLPNRHHRGGMGVVPFSSLKTKTSRVLIAVKFVCMNMLISVTSGSIEGQ